MLNINKGEPWIFWPNSICDTLPENPANKVLSGDQYFKITFDLELTDTSDNQKTLFTIVPRYTGLDLFYDKMKLTITCEEEVHYIDLPLLITRNERVVIVLEHLPKEYFRLFINNNEVYSHSLMNESFGIADNPHVIIGAGNFPKNDFNLNYTSFNLFEFKVEDKKEVLAHHLFNEYIFDKSVDITDNCNFIHKL